MKSSWSWTWTSLWLRSSRFYSEIILIFQNKNLGRMLQRSRSKWSTKSDSKIYPHKRAKVCQYFVFTVQKAKEIESSRVKDGDLWKIYSLIWLYFLATLIVFELFCQRKHDLFTILTTGSCHETLRNQSQDDICSLGWLKIFTQL